MYWINQLTRPEICNVLGRSRSTTLVSIRTIINDRISLMNLKDFERNLIERKIKAIKFFTSLEFQEKK